MPLLPCYKCTTLGPGSAVKHKWARLNLQSVCHNNHLSHCRSSGETCKNKHTHHKRDKKQKKVAFVRSELWNRTGLSFVLAKKYCVISPFTRHAAFSTLTQWFPGPTWILIISKVTRRQTGAMISQQCCSIFKKQEHLQILTTLGCALKSKEGILCGTLPLISGRSSTSPNESACFYLCSALLTLFLKCPMLGRQSW